MTQVKLVSWTMPNLDCSIPANTITEYIAYVARVSNPGNQNNIETLEKLVKYLIKNKHWSPLELVHITLEIDCTRDIGRQILRHRSFSFQEFSQRYAIPDMKFEPKEVRLQDTKNRQNSIETADEELKQWWKKQQENCFNTNQAIYMQAVDRGIAKEVARSVLPEGLTVTKIYMCGSLRSWWHWIELRSQLSTQKEHREIAIKSAEIISGIFPLILDAVYKQ